MFISHIDNNFKFNEAAWVISVNSCLRESEQITKATIVIEGVINHRLLFGSYEVSAEACEDSSDAKPRACICQVDCFEGSRYQGDFSRRSSVAYYATPKECQVLAQHVRCISDLFDKAKESDAGISPQLVIYPSSIEKACVTWCLDLLWDHHILYRSD